MTNMKFSCFSTKSSVATSQNFDVVPDIMTVGKAIAGGLPMSAVISTPEIMDKWPVGTHGTTFGGNPCAAAAGCAVLK